MFKTNIATSVNPPFISGRLALELGVASALLAHAECFPLKPLHLFLSLLLENDGMDDRKMIAVVPQQELLDKLMI